MFRNIYKRVEYLRNTSSHFIAWICPILRFVNPIKHEYIYYEGDDIKHLYFNVQGTNAFVLPKFNNIAYIQITQSSTFGFEDVTANLFDNFDDPVDYKESFDNWYEHVSQFRRILTA